MKRTTVLLLLLTIILLSPSALRAQRIVYVNSSTTTGQDDGSSWDNAYLNLQDALANHQNGDVIWLAQGTYHPDRGDSVTVRDAQASFVLSDTLSITGGFLGVETSADQRPAESRSILSGDIGNFDIQLDNSFHIVTIPDSSVITLESVTIRDAYNHYPASQNNSGAGVHCKGSVLVLVDVDITNNEAVAVDNYGTLYGGFGGGLYARECRVAGKNVTFAFNRAFVAGAILMQSGFASFEGINGYSNYSENESDFRFRSARIIGGRFPDSNYALSAYDSLRIEDSVFESNQIAVRSEGSLVVLRSSFIGNGSSVLSYGPTTIVNSRFVANTGTPLYVHDAKRVLIANSLFAWNRTGGAATAINVSYDSQVEFVNTTIAFNHTTVESGGAINFSNENLSSVHLKNSILWENTAATEVHDIAPNIGLVSLAASTITTTLQGAEDAGDNVFSDPSFYDPDGLDNIVGTTDDNFGLRDVSAAIDAGLAAYLPPDSLDLDQDRNLGEPLPLDLNDEPRLVSNSVDMGAIETAEIPPKIVYVDSDASGANNGQNWTDAFPDFTDGLTVARYGDQVWVAEGTYRPDRGTADRTMSFVVPNGVGVFGGFEGNETSASNRQGERPILSGDIGDSSNDGDNTCHVVTTSATDATTVIDNFIIEDGKASCGSDQNGAGILNVGGSPLLRELLIRNCFAGAYGAGGVLADGNGGGLYTIDGSPRLEGVGFIENRAFRGGGVFAESSVINWDGGQMSDNDADSTGGGITLVRSALNIADAPIQRNRATVGGGVHADDISTVSFGASMRLDYNEASASCGGLRASTMSFALEEDGGRIVGNLAGGDGAGVCLFGPAVLRNLYIAQNESVAGSGGAVAVYDGYTTITLSRIERNTAGNDGGAAFVAGGEINLTSNRFLQNSANREGGAIAVDGGSASIVNSLFTGNTADAGGGLLAAGSGDIFVTSTTFSGNTGSDGGTGNSVALHGGVAAIISNSILWTGDGSNALVVEPTSSVSVTHSIVEGGLGPSVIDVGGNLDTDPLFVDADGGDNRIGTNDDNARPQLGSPAIDAGDNSYLPSDANDVDGDGNTIEQLPRDLDRALRLDLKTFVVDMGAYERYQDPTEGILFVDSDATGRNNGSSWENAFVDLDPALNEVDNGEEIWIAEGTYFPGYATDPGGYFEIPNGVRVLGGFDGSEVILSERNPVDHESILSGFLPTDARSYKVVNFDGVDSTTVLDGVTVTGSGGRPPVGDATTGGIRIEGGSPMLRNLIVSYNTAQSELGGGGGIVNIGGDPVIEDVLFTRNFTLSGGGLYSLDGSPKLRNVVFEYNGGWRSGGGMESRGTGTPVLENVTFYHNGVGQHGSSGGGMANKPPARPLLRNVDFIENSALGEFQTGSCGGMAGADGATLINVTFIGNRADGTAGLCAGETTSMINSTFIGNESTFGGAFGGVDSLVNSVVAHNTGFAEAIGLSGNRMVLNSTIHNNTIRYPGYFAAPCATYGNSIVTSTTIDSTCTSTFGNSIIEGGIPTSAIDAGDNLDLDPMFIDIDGVDDVAGNADDDFTVFDNSPAVDAGRIQFVPFDDFDLDGDGNRQERLPLDRAGNPRFASAQIGEEPRVDIGAFELDSSLPVTLSSFEAVSDEASVELTWKTESEVDLAGFMVQQQVDVVDGRSTEWEDVQFVAAYGPDKSGVYSHRIEGLLPGHYTYRLKSIDLDGSSSFSELLSADVSLREPWMVGSIYPNPTQSLASMNVAVREEQRVRVEVFDLTGRRVRLVLDEPFVANTTRRVELRAEGLSAGLYLCRVTGAEFQDVQRFVVVR